MYDLKEALDILDSGEWVSLGYVCADKRRNSYGDIIRIPKCRLLKAGPSAANSERTSEIIRYSRNPNHDEHATRNLQLAGGAIRKVHIRLIFYIKDTKIL